MSGSKVVHYGEPALFPFCLRSARDLFSALSIWKTMVPTHRLSPQASSAMLHRLTDGREDGDGGGGSAFHHRRGHHRAHAVGGIARLSLNNVGDRSLAAYSSGRNTSRACLAPHGWGRSLCTLQDRSGRCGFRDVAAACPRTWPGRPCGARTRSIRQIRASNGRFRRRRTTEAQTRVVRQSDPTSAAGYAA
jgi:hypothetical protein